MSTQRYISTSFWDDPWVLTLKPNEKYLYLYLLTNPLTNIAGVYQISMRRMCFDTGLKENSIKEIIGLFQQKKKVFYYDETYIILPNWPKHQKWQTRTKIKYGIISCLQELPKKVLLKLSDSNYMFDLSLVDKTFIISKQRVGVSGATCQKIYEKYHNKCAICGSEDNLSVYYIRDIKDGGNNSIDNLELLCTSCYQTKHSPDMISGHDTQSRYDSNYSDSDSDIDIDYYRETTTTKIVDNLETPVDNSKKESPPIDNSKSSRFVKPTVAEIASYCRERKNSINAQVFFDYYESKGWMIGKNHMKNWQAAVRTWEQHETEREGQAQPSKSIPLYWRKCACGTVFSIYDRCPKCGNDGTIVTGAEYPKNYKSENECRDTG